LSSTPASLSWRSRRHNRVDCSISHHRISAGTFEAKKVEKANIRHAHLEPNSSFCSCQARWEKAEIDYHNEEKTSLTVLTPVLQSRRLTTIAEEDETSACPVKCEHEQMPSALPSRDKANLPFTPRGAEVLKYVCGNLCLPRVLSAPAVSRPRSPRLRLGRPLSLRARYWSRRRE
jgi:hypothetical protein